MDRDGRGRRDPGHPEQVGQTKVVRVAGPTMTWTVAPRSSKRGGGEIAEASPARTAMSRSVGLQLLVRMADRPRINSRRLLEVRGIRAGRGGQCPWRRSRRSGPAAGTRRGDGLADAMRLSQAMTVKMAVAGAERGGGKAVLAVPELPVGDARRTLLLRYGELVASLGGTYRTAGDMNIAPADLDIVKERCEWVYGTTGAGGNSGRGTAIGVLHGIRAAVEHVFGSPDLAGRSVLVQGVGAVGHDLARFLAAEGAAVLVSDVDEARAAETGGTVVPAGRGADDRVRRVLAVCGRRDVERRDVAGLRCRIVAGSANNQLATPEDAQRCTIAGSSTRPTTS